MGDNSTTSSDQSDITVGALRPRGSLDKCSPTTLPFLNLSLSDSFPAVEDTDSPVLDQSEVQRLTGNSQSVETPNMEDDTQMTSLSEDHTYDDFQQSLHCDHCSDVEDEAHELFEASCVPDQCNLQSDTDQCKLVQESDQCNPAYEPDQEEECLVVEDLLLDYKSVGSQTSLPFVSHDQSGDDEQEACDTADQSKSISIDKHSRSSSASKGMKNTAV